MFLTKYANKMTRKIEKEQLMIENSYNYWCDQLFEKSVRIFEWDGLPFPQKEIEIRSIYNGFCGVVDDKNCGIMAATGSLSGPTQYWDEFKDFTYAAATARGGTKRIGFDCVIVSNNSLRNSMFPLISRYASLLAHAEISLKCALINLRETNSFATEDDDTAESISEYYDQIYRGEQRVIVDKSMVESITNLTPEKTSSAVKDCIDARNEILRSFYQEIGVRYTRDKKERMVADEVTNDDQMLLLNISDMLKQRQKAAEEMNEIFGLSVSVKLSPEFEMIQKEEVADDEG